MVRPQPNPVAPLAMGQLNVSNHLIGNREALNQAWERDGYWYFKGVLDKEVIRTMRAVWIDYLQRHGVIDPGVDENRYNGARIEDDSLIRLTEFSERNLHTMLTEDPRINATMKEILGDEPFWLPIAEYRANPPGEDPQQSRFIFPHQDGFYSRGMAMKICWIPLDSVDAEVGGCAWVGGAHRGPILHDLNNPPLFQIPADVVPIQGWQRADYEPGDIVIFHLNTPHSGLTNVSRDRFRMTMDIRVTEASGPTPAVGSLVSLTPEQVKLRDNKTGIEETYSVTPDTYVRGKDGQKREGADIPKTFKPGELIIVNSLDGRNATLVRSIN
ncbi:MAG: phytanoyl-CoA dioxygenase family protein [Sinobacteraceae bacterium]|nr:phytanoyl-CoA dioxygenase family protein [Nevskiaceae bacterium]